MSAIADLVVTIIVLAVPDACTRLLLLLSFLYGYYREQIMAKARVNDSSPSFTINRFGSSDSGFASLSSGKTERFPIKDDHLENSITNAGGQSQELSWPKDSELTYAMSEEEEDLLVDEDLGNIRDQDDAISDISTNTAFSTMSGSGMDNLQKDPVGNFYLFNANLRTLLEEIEELNTDLTELIDIGDSGLARKQDGAIKELKRTITTDFSKLKDQSRVTRNKFKIEARRQLSSKTAEAIIQDKVLQQNLHLVHKAAEVTKSIDEYIEARGLNLLVTKADKETKITWPTFTGETLPLIADFLFEMEELMVLAAIPVSHRGIALKQHISGKAENIIKDTIQELNPSFSCLADVLKTHFGETSTQMELIQSLHQKHGPVPATSDMSRSIREIYDVTKGHITLLEAAASLHQQYMTGSLKENPITGSYLTIIGGMLPREDRKRLTNISGYHLMELQEQFQEIYDIFKSTQQFALTEISRYGQSTKSCG